MLLLPVFRLLSGLTRFSCRWQVALNYISPSGRICTCSECLLFQITYIQCTHTKHCRSGVCQTPQPCSLLGYTNILYGT